MGETVKPVRRTPDEAWRLILDAAQAAIARTGPEGLRLHDIATAAGISHPLILHHFGSRAGLVRPGKYARQPEPAAEPLLWIAGTADR